VTQLNLDTETYSECDLKTAGGWVYSRHPSTECLLLTWAVDDEPVRLWDCTDDPWMPDELRELLLHGPDVTLVAHNAQFDRWILQNVLDIPTPVERWRCTMAKAYTMGLPGALGQLASALELDDDSQKIADGKRLIQKFCKPQPKNRKLLRHTAETDPEEWQRFIEYAVRDTHTLREIDRALPNWNYRGSEVDLWHLDQRINDRGLPIDVPLARTLARLCDAELERLNAEIAGLTDGTVTANTQRDRILAWLRDQGVHTEGFRKADVTELLERDDLPGKARRVIEIRKEAGRSSTSKYVRFGQTVDPRDHRIRGAFQYGGAMRTLRWAGRLIQPQNFPRPPEDFDGELAARAVMNGDADWAYGDLMALGADCLRSVICAPNGKKLVAGDYSNIEGRMLAWLAGEKWKLDAFRAYDAGHGHDLYLLAYARAFGVLPENVTKDQRFIGKVTELACGYQGAVGAFAQMAANFGAELPEDEALRAVKAWRAANPRIVALWYDLENAAKLALRNPGQAYAAGKVAFKTTGKWLLCRLPSGRFLCYYGARLVQRGQCIQYEGLDLGKWKRLDIYGGKFAENITQAASRDVMAHNMPRAERAGFPIIGTVHDEIITEVDAGFGSPAALEAAMSDVPPWAQGLPIAVSAWEGRRYRK